MLRQDFLPILFDERECFAEGWMEQPVPDMQAFQAGCR